MAEANPGAGLVEGKIALVTGAGTGIGRAAALLFAREGARVLATDIADESLEETVDLIRRAGGEASFRHVDVSLEGDVASMVEGCVSEFGRLDCAFNNAGIAGPAAPLHQIDFEAFNRTLAINLGGVFLCMKYEIPVMQSQKAGAIVNTSSGAGVMAAPTMSPYCATKHAILGLTRTAAIENARTGVRVNAVCPGSTDTPMLRATMELGEGVEKMIRASMPGGRFGTAEEVAESVVWLCSDRASFVSGHSMLVDGGSVAR